MNWQTNISKGLNMLELTCEAAILATDQRTWKCCYAIQPTIISPYSGAVPNTVHLAQNKSPSTQYQYPRDNSIMFIYREIPNKQKMYVHFSDTVLCITRLDSSSLLVYG